MPEDDTALLTKYLDSLEVNNWPFIPKKNFESEKDYINQILIDDKSVDDFLKIFPGKTLLSRVVKALGFNSSDDYLNLVISALNDENKKGPLTNLKNEITVALAKYLKFN